MILCDDQQERGQWAFISKHTSESPFEREIEVGLKKVTYLSVKYFKYSFSRGIIY